MSNKNCGGSVISKNILEGKGKLFWCIREEPVNEVDNGWRFFSDIDTDKFLSKAKNLCVVAWETVVEIEPDVEKIFNLPIGSDLAYDEDDNGEMHFFDTNTEVKIV